MSSYLCYEIAESGNLSTKYNMSNLFEIVKSFKFWEISSFANYSKLSFLKPKLLIKKIEF